MNLFGLWYYSSRETSLMFFISMRWLLMPPLVDWVWIKSQWLVNSNPWIEQVNQNLRAAFWCFLCFVTVCTTIEMIEGVAPCWLLWRNLIMMMEQPGCHATTMTNHCGYLAAQIWKANDPQANIILLESWLLDKCVFNSSLVQVSYTTSFYWNTTYCSANNVRGQSTPETQYGPQVTSSPVASVF